MAYGSLSTTIVNYGTFIPWSSYTLGADQPVHDAIYVVFRSILASNDLFSIEQLTSKIDI
jgi:hypothetical protein